MNNTQTNFRFLLATIISIIAGVVAGILFPASTINYTTTLFIQLITSVIILILARYSLPPANRQQCQNVTNSTHADTVGFLLFGTFGSYIFSVLSLTVIDLPITVIKSVIFGISIGFFSLMILGIILLFTKALRNSR